MPWPTPVRATNRVPFVLRPPWWLACMMVLAVSASGMPSTVAQDQTADPVMGRIARQTVEIRQEMARTIKNLTEQIQKSPKSISLYSQRGDAQFFLGDFPKSVADYEKMVELDPEIDSSHWRLGIAKFYAGKFEAAAKQFELYHSFDDVDRENGIWRYLSQVKAYGREKAREGLLKYKKDDREPFPAVYQLFAGKITPEAILKEIRAAAIDDEERQKRLFYAELYIGLNYAVENDPRQAFEHLKAATANEWPQASGFGPRYMWQVGRVHLLQIEKEANESATKQPGTDPKP